MAYQKSAAHHKNLAMAQLVARSIIKHCRFCHSPRASNGLAIHERNCVNNPAVGHPCPVCGAPSKPNNVTCSKRCSNTHFRSGPNHGNWSGENYRKVCFDAHEKICVVCGESLIVAVHHMNEDHSDNRPENLVPLCPTHHQYWHSRHRHLIEAAVLSYLKERVAVRATVQSPFA